MAALLGDSTLPEEVPNLRFTDPQQLDTLKIINIVTNVISAISAFLVLAILFAMRCYDRRLVDRVSLRLAAAVSLTDLISSISLIANSYLSNGTTSAVISCQIIAFLIIWLTNQYLFLTTAIAFNLQWHFLQDRYYNPAFEKWYYIVSVLLAAITASVPLASGALGSDIAQDTCWFTPSYTLQTQLWECGTYIIPQMACCAYGMVVVGFVIKKLKQNDFDKKNTVVRRILFYPLTPPLTQVGFIVSEVYMFSTMQVSYPLNVWGVLSKGLPGFFNLVGFLLDPAFMGVLRILKRDVIRRYGGSTHDSLDRTDSTLSDPSSTNMDKRTFKIYQGHGALDFVLPRDTSAALAPLRNKEENCNEGQLVHRLFRRFFKKEQQQPVAHHHQDEEEQQTYSVSPIILDNSSELTIQPIALPPIVALDGLEEAVPWRVLEATTGHTSPRTDPVNREIDSWLELNEPTSPSSRMSQWFTKRGDSFESVRECVARRSRSIRRWCSQQQQLHQQNLLEKPTADNDDIRWPTTFDHPTTTLQVVPE